MEAAAVREEALVTGTSRGRVLAALILALALGALDQTVVASSLPSIVRDIGGFSLFPWVFSGYVLAQAVTIPLYGRFADMIGRKPVLLYGMTVFLIGSALCGAAWSMPALIAFRVLQGLGAGAVQPVVLTLAGDLYSIEERARVQGYLSSVWAVSALAGPAIGGFLTQYASWRWIFYINVPVGLVAIAVITRELREVQLPPKHHRIDYPGAGLLAAGLGLLTYGLLNAGSRWGWTSATTTATLGAAVAILALFCLWENRAPEPILPLHALRNRGIVAACCAALMVGSLAIGIASFLPTYLQAVVGAPPAVAAFTFAAMSIGWPVASSLSGRLYLRIGFRNCALVGTCGCIAAGCLLLVLPTTQGAAVFVPASGLMGLGIGLVSAPMLIGAQSLVGRAQRGVVTGTVLFSRNLGMALGAAIYGSIATLVLRGRLESAGDAPGLPRSADSASRALLAHRHLSPGALELVRDALEASSKYVFAAMVAVACLGLLALLASPRRPTPVEEGA
jgi:EmrB/QacA subfamily drug resistance transporter